MRYLLDTNICVEHLRGKIDIWPFIEARGLDNCFLSEIVVAELKIGEIIIAKKGGVRFSQHLNEFLNVFQILPISSAIEYFAQEKCRLQFAGTPVANNFDLLIGCSGVMNDMIVVTDNYKDFRNIQGIQLENWLEH